MHFFYTLLTIPYCWWWHRVRSYWTESLILISLFHWELFCIILWIMWNAQITNTTMINLYQKRMSTNLNAILWMIYELFEMCMQTGNNILQIFQHVHINFLIFNIEVTVQCNVQLKACSWFELHRTFVEIEKDYLIVPMKMRITYTRKLYCYHNYTTLTGFKWPTIEPL